MSETELTGTIEERLVGAGSKSEMPAVVLVPDPAAGTAEDPEVEPTVLRRRDATRLDAEPELLAYVGRHVRVHGTRAWTTFVVDEIELLDDDRGQGDTP